MAKQHVETTCRNNMSKRHVKTTCQNNMSKRACQYAMPLQHTVTLTVTVSATATVTLTVTVTVCLSVCLSRIQLHHLQHHRLQHEQDFFDVAIHMGIGHADAPWSSSFYIFSSIPWLPLVDLYYCVSSRFVGPLRLKLREVERVTRITGSRHHQTTTGASPINSDNGNDTCKTSVADWASRS